MKDWLMFLRGLLYEKFTNFSFLPDGFVTFFSTTRCKNIGKPKAAGCGKKSKGADKKTYYGEKKNRQTDGEMKKYKPEKMKTDQRGQKRNRQPDDQIANQKRHNRIYNKTVPGRIENVLEKPRWVLV